MDELSHGLPYPDWACSCGRNFDTPAAMLTHMDRCKDWAGSDDTHPRNVTKPRACIPTDLKNGDGTAEKLKRQRE